MSRADLHELTDFFHQLAAPTCHIDRN